MITSNNDKAQRNVNRKTVMNLTKDERNKLINEIQHFFLEERNEEIGIIAAETVLEFFLENMGCIIYNKVLDEAKLWFSKKLEDVEGDYYLLYK